MAIDAKQSFLSQIEHKCADMLTVTEVPEELLERIRKELKEIKLTK